MADRAASVGTVASFDRIAIHDSQSRRIRRPDLDTTCGQETQVPLKDETDEKPRRKGSRMRLRSLFTRQRVSDFNEGAMASTGEISQRGSVRTSLADIGYWPHTLTRQQSISIPSVLSAPIARTPSFSSLRHKKSVSSVVGKLQAQSARGSLATWDPPPLFQAYSQAIKHATLAACTMSADALLRWHNKGSLSLRNTLAPSQPLDAVDERGHELLGRVIKRKHRRNSSSAGLRLEFTNKIYVLVTSGHLLQYACEGPFNRAPEKTLHLGKNSAAYASDLIPGCHWVLQVSSVAHADGAATHKPSLLSRVAHWGGEKRFASNYLMIFERADDMESWMSALRREISVFAGENPMSETGRPAVDEEPHQVQAKGSQGTLVASPSERFSRTLPSDLSWDQAAALKSPVFLQDGIDSVFTRKQSFDDGSTVSGMSHDGRQLEGLRDSANRLSLVSSGQRTVITSAGSSPACSPVRETFEANPRAEQTAHRDQEAPQEPQPRPRPRPNAGAVYERRQSMQSVNYLFEMRPWSARPESNHSTIWLQDPTPFFLSSPRYSTTPNFSVPHNTSKRHSAAKTAPIDSIGQASPPLQLLTPAKPLRRPPPTTLTANARPLSPTLHTGQGLSSISAVDALEMPLQHRLDQVPGLLPPLEHMPPYSSMMSHLETPEHKTHSPRKRILLGSLRASDNPGCAIANHSTSGPDPARQAKSASPRSPSAGQRQPLRFSLYPSITTNLPAPALGPSRVPVRTRPQTPVTTRKFVASPNAPRISVSSQHLRLNALSQQSALPHRRSMSQLTHGPPPAPPPTCALPPLPTGPMRTWVDGPEHEGEKATIGA